MIKTTLGKIIRVFKKIYFLNFYMTPVCKFGQLESFGFPSNKIIKKKERNTVPLKPA